MATQFERLKSRDTFKYSLISGAELVGKYGFPKLTGIGAIPDKLIPFNMAMSAGDISDSWIHFFIDDYQFERVWKYPMRYMNVFCRAKGIIAPDYSMYTGMPQAQIIWNCYRSRALAYWYGKNGVPTIPVVEWSEYSDLDWCMDGIPKFSTIAIGTYGSNRNAASRYALLKGIERICCDVSPSTLLVYGNEMREIQSLCKNVVFKENYCQTMKKRL